MRTVFLGLLLAVAAFDQTGTPDCQFTVTFSASGVGSANANKTTPCVVWRVSYWTSNASSVSLTLEGAPDNGSGSPGSYTALTAVQSTTNPATGTNSGTIVACCDYYPFIRLNLGTFTGTSLTARVYGWKAWVTPVNAIQGATGPSGPAGPSGPTGPAGPSGVPTFDSGCGTGVSAPNATDSGGTITTGTGTGSNCVVTFHTSWVTDPRCVVTEQAGSLLGAFNYSHNATTLTIAVANNDGASFDYICTK